MTTDSDNGDTETDADIETDGDTETDADIETNADTETDADTETNDDDRIPDIPRDVVDEAERLTHLARDTVNPDEAELYREKRVEVVEAHDYAPRIRDEDDTLVCYPDEWVEDGTVQFDRIDDTDRAVERTLSGPGDADQWDRVEDANTAVVEKVREEATDVHAANARAFADFMGNHYVREVWTATEPELTEFREEYYPRNVWADDEQAAALERSLELVFDCGEEIRE